MSENSNSIKVHDREFKEIINKIFEQEFKEENKFSELIKQIKFSPNFIFDFETNSLQILFEYIL